MYKYGGTYLDLDVILMKSLSKKPINFVVTESMYNNIIGSSIMNFDYQGVGHAIAESCIRQVSLLFYHFFIIAMDYLLFLENCKILSTELTGAIIVMVFYIESCENYAKPVLQC